MRIRWLMFFLAAASVAGAQQRVLQLEIGDPSRKGRDVPLLLDAITDCASGEFLTPPDLAKRLASVRFLFIGESHTSTGFHAAQHRLLEELHRAGRKVLIGLEMYPYTEQAYLDRWCRGLLTEEGFIELSRWYRNWGYHWDYYRDIFLIARDFGMPMFALNAPREVVAAVRKKGFSDLTPEEAAHIPSQIDTSSEEHLTLFKAFFEEDEGMHSRMNEEQWRSMFEAQCTWDATMAFQAVRALQQHGGEDGIMVVLIGSGHVAYGLGIQRQAAQWHDGKMSSVIPIMVQDEEKRPVESVRASYADFIWGLAPERSPAFPDLGIATTEVSGGERRRVVNVSRESPASAAGFEIGDVLVAMDGTPLPDRETLNRLMAGKRWGDAARFTVARNGTEIRLQVVLRRRL